MTEATSIQIEDDLIVSIEPLAGVQDRRDGGADPDSTDADPDGSDINA